MILSTKNYQEPSVFTPENLLREARRQKGVAAGTFPEICILDPDGDIVRRLIQQKRATRDPFWACYHTDLYTFEQEGIPFGVVGCAVGAPFAVLVAEEMFASGCQLLISITSAGQIAETRNPPYFIVIEKALRDEGTSSHYLPPSEYCSIDASMLALFQAFPHLSSLSLEIGKTWTTDAPFRETASAIEKCRALGILAVEMEAAALYAFAEAKRKRVICLAHVTNHMATIEGDFEKGTANGSDEALALLARIAQVYQTTIR